MKLTNYIKESYKELKEKTTWPTRKELTNSAVIVLVASIVIALIVWVMDLGFENLMQFVYKFI